jgi:serine/threonine protein kinase
MSWTATTPSGAKKQAQPAQSGGQKDIPPSPRSFHLKADSRTVSTVNREFNSEAEKWEIDASEITLGEKLGTGSFGEVYKGKLRSVEVAVKKLTLKKLDEKKMEAFRKEVGIMSKLRHPNVLLFMGACLEPGNLMIVTELMSQGSVYDLLHKHPEQLTFRKKMEIARGAAKGMNWLHQSKPVSFIHRDLKTGNLLVDDNWCVKVCDFGLTLVKKNEEKANYGAIGTPLWMAPEVLTNQAYDESADLYSFGIVLWELMTHKDPYPEINTFGEMLEKVCKQHHRPAIPESCPPTLRALMEKCWDPVPSKRPSFVDVLSEIDGILIEGLLIDPQAIAFWKKNFNTAEKVPFKEFCQKISDHYKLVVESDSEIGLCLKDLLERNDHVTVDNLGNFLQWFGPFDGQLITRVVELLREKWFHGDISSAEAEKLLKSEPKGTYLVRFSTREPGSYAISSRTKDQIKHFRVMHKAGENYVIGARSFDSLHNLLKLIAADIGLKKKQACPGSKYEQIFAKKKNLIMPSAYEEVHL